jgi:hypothetical protein
MKLLSGVESVGNVGLISTAFKASIKALFPQTVNYNPNPRVRNIVRGKNTRNLTQDNFVVQYAPHIWHGI